MPFPTISRRHLLQGTAATALAATLPVRAAFAKDTVVGFVYVGSRDDYGYNQAHAAGAAALKKMAGIKVVEEEKVPETDAVEKTMESMINLDGATLVFPTSFGYFDPHMLKMAAKYGVTPPPPPRGAEIFWLRVYVPAYRAVPWPVRSAIMRRMPGSHRMTWTKTQRPLSPGPGG